MGAEPFGSLSMRNGVRRNRLTRGRHSDSKDMEAGLAIVEIFSKRSRRSRGQVPDVYIYAELPHALRVQIVQIWMANLGTREEYSDAFGYEVKEVYGDIVSSLRHEYGVFELVEGVVEVDGAMDELIEFFLRESDVERTLDAVELSFRAIVARGQQHNDRGGADRAIGELNERLKEHGVGYHFEPPQILRIDSEFIHSQVVQPSLNVLQGKHYAGAQQEFLRAHEHYRKGNAKEALSECLKSFESVMKAICDKRGWGYREDAASKSLIQVCLQNRLSPSFWESHYSALRSLLESGVPTGRNKLGGHGQGTTPVSVPHHLVAYMLHMTASAIVFLAEGEKNLP